jgi:hypothetical protein
MISGGYVYGAASAAGVVRRYGSDGRRHTVAAVTGRAAAVCRVVLLRLLLRGHNGDNDPASLLCYTTRTRADELPLPDHTPIRGLETDFANSVKGRRLLLRHLGFCCAAGLL